MSDWVGLLLVDKPAGPTSHDVVARVRRATAQRRVGHAGTLDPAATGLLPLVLGRATRLVRYMPASPKTYTGTLRLGLSTDSDDMDGAVVERHQGPLPDFAAVREQAALMSGRSLQRPPNVSARKQGGRRLYKLARRGVQVEPVATEIEVTRFDLEATEDPAEFAFVAEVSGGTYIRSMARDLGRSLGCGGTLATLRRTRIGSLDVADALPLSVDAPLDPDQLFEHLRPLERMPLTPPPVTLADGAEVDRFLHGRKLRIEAAAQVVRVLSPAGSLLGIAEIREELLRPRVVLARPDRP